MTPLHCTSWLPGVVGCVTTKTIHSLASPPPAFNPSTVHHCSFAPHMLSHPLFTSLLPLSLSIFFHCRRHSQAVCTFAKPISQPSTSLPATRLSQHPTGHERHFWPHSDSIQHSTHAPRTGRGARCPAPSQPPPPSLLLRTTDALRELYSLLLSISAPLSCVLRPQPANTSIFVQRLLPLDPIVWVAARSSSVFCIPIPSRIV